VSKVGFRDRASAAIKSKEALATAAGAKRFTERRIQAAESFPAMEAARDEAQRIRLHTLANLDRYLEQFAQSATNAGNFVHWATDGEEANKIVLRIAEESESRLVVKSKSMVTEEIELNHTLEEAGIEVVETDLGEFIIQLAGETPSHIIAPVVHKTRKQIGELFAEKIGVDLTEDPEELNAAARFYLRTKFLEADLGISGVNFGVADTGSISLVTNEGNGRLTTTAPRVHIAVMGMERLVPTIRDLGVMLEVLARSATGQALTSYSTVITGPRQPDDADGPDELHIIIVDNGRSNVLGQSTAEILGCIRCGACLNVCPVYRESGGHAYGTTYSGPVGAVLVPSLLGLQDWGDLAQASSLCGACLEACPVRIDLPRMLIELRQRRVAQRLATPGLRRAIKTYAAAATRPTAFRVMMRAGGLAARFRPTTSGWMTSLPAMGKKWTSTRDFPSPETRTFHQRWKKSR